MPKSDLAIFLADLSGDMMPIDLHTHSTASDGTDSPARLVQKAAACGISALALTDHDAVSGLAEAEEVASDCGLSLIRGCEISTTTPLGEVHILGLWLPKSSEKLENYLKILRQQRQERIRAMVAKLKELGIDINIEELNFQDDTATGRPQLAALLVKKGIVENLREAFRLYLGREGAAWVPRYNVDPRDAVKLLSSIGATTVFAHPLQMRHQDRELYEFTSELAKNGLDAIEVWHSAHSTGDMERLKKMATHFDLGISGGSDYHGTIKPDLKLGYINDKQAIPDVIYNNLIKMRKQKGLPC